MQNNYQPLAERLRPQSLNDLYGQEHLTGPDTALRKSMETGNLPSMILWGPPGSGKTSLARMITGDERP
ncbi:MAG: AAA family ATPase, partial [Bacteroidales bacterium]